MNGLQRIGAVLSGSATDRPPYGIVSSVYGAKAGNMDLERYFADPQWYALGQEAVVELLDPDILFGPFVFAFHAAAFGADPAPQKEAAPGVRKPAFRSVQEAAACPLPPVDENRYLSFLVKSVEFLALRFGKEKALVAPIISPVDLPVLLVGMEAWLEALLFDKPAAAALAEKMTDHFTQMARAYVHAGAAMLATPVMFVNPEILDEANIRTLTLPILEKAFAASPVPVAFHHGGTRLSNWISLFSSLPNLGGFILGEKDSFTEARATLGEEPILMGNISGPHFDAYGPSGISKRLEDLVNDRRKDRRWICTSSGAEVPYRTDPAVLTAVRDFFERMVT
jgi:uroporphyrinogen decarboxylase